VLLLLFIFDPKCPPHERHNIIAFSHPPLHPHNQFYIIFNISQNNTTYLGPKSTCPPNNNTPLKSPKMSYSNTPSNAKASLTSQNLRLLLQLAPKVPLMLKTTLFHLLHLSEQSKYWDLREELTINVVRAFLTPDHGSLLSISKTQDLLLKDRGPQGRIWVSTYVAPADDGAQKAVSAALEGLRPGNSDREALDEIFNLPPSCSVEAEWTGYRAGVDKDARMPVGMSERERYDEMMREVTSPATVLYFHGGAYWLMDPSTHRPLAKRLAKLTGGRMYSVRYRLSPKHAFPAALIDGLVSYLTLLFPPEDAFHTAVRAEDVVFSGDRYVASRSHS